MEYLPYILLAVVLLIVALQMALYLTAKAAQGKAPPAYDDLLGESSRDCPQLLFYFHSEHCSPCRQMTPLVEAAAQQHGCVVIVDVARQMEVARRFSVRVTPTLMRVRGGIVDKVVVGAISEAKLQALLEAGA